MLYPKVRRLPAWCPPFCYDMCVFFVNWLISLFMHAWSCVYAHSWSSFSKSILRCHCAYALVPYFRVDPRPGKNESWSSQMSSPTSYGRSSHMQGGSRPYQTWGLNSGDLQWNTEGLFTGGSPIYIFGWWFQTFWISLLTSITKWLVGWSTSIFLSLGLKPPTRYHMHTHVTGM